MGRGGRTSACNTTGFSSTQTTGSFSDSDFSYSASTSSMRARYSSLSSAIHQPFFPPRLQFVALEKDANRLPAHRRRHLLYRLSGNQPYTPPRHAPWRRTTYHRNDSLALACVQRGRLTGPRFFIQCRLQPFFFIAPSNGSPGFSSYLDICA